jgi:TonB family protein
MKFRLAHLCLLLIFGCVAQNQNSGPKTTTSNQSTPVDELNVLPLLPNEYAMADSMPYPGYNLNEYLSANLKYPKMAVDNKIEGVVLVTFQVGPEGEIRDPKIKRGIGYKCDDEAWRLVFEMPKWVPGKKDGKSVTVRCYVPVLFRLGR